MIPIRDIIPTRTTPFVVLTVVALKAAALLYLVAAAQPTGAVVLYLLLDMLFLWLFGETVEDRTGHMRFVVLYAAGGIAAGVAQSMFATGVPPVIAAGGGATAGVLGGYLILYPRSRIVTLIPFVTAVPVIEVPAIHLVVAWFALHWPVGSAGAHLAAFATGMSGVFLLRRPERLRVEWWNEVTSRAR